MNVSLISTGVWVLSETKFILGFMVFLAFLGFIVAYLPEGMQFIDLFDFVWFGGGMIGISGACVIVSGVPCAIALAVFGILTIWQYVIVSVDWIALLVFTPLVVTLIYLMSKLGRGGG